MTKPTLLFVLVLFMLVLSTFAAVPLPLSAQDRESSASLKETLEFITNNVSVYGKSNGNSDAVQYGFTQVDVCKVQVKFEQNPHTGRELARTLRFSLSDIDPLSIRVIHVDYPSIGMGYSVEARTSKAQEVVEIYGPMDNGGQAYKVAAVGVMIRDEEISKRIAKALTHAVKLCGGKVDPF